MKGLNAALGKLTILPVGRDASAPLSETLLWYPVAGLILGVLAGLPFLLPGGINPVSAVASVVLAVLLTGGVNLPGLAGMADGFAAGQTPAQRLARMTGGPLGAFGAATVLLVLLLKSVALYALQADAWLWLIAAMTLSRAMQVEQMVLMPSAGADRGGPAVDTRTGRRLRLFTAGAAFVLCILMLKLAGVLIIPGVLVFSALLRRYFNDRAGGITPGLLGAFNEIMEAAVLALPVLFSE